MSYRETSGSPLKRRTVGASSRVWWLLPEIELVRALFGMSGRFLLQREQRPHPAKDTIARRMGRRPRTVQRHLTTLEKVGFIRCNPAPDIARLAEPDVTIWTACLDDQLAGMVGVKRVNREAEELKSMRVAPHYEGRGIGLALLRHAIAECQRAGYRNLYLETYGRDNDGIACETYR